MSWHDILNPFRSRRLQKHERPIKTDQRKWTRDQIYEAVTEILMDELVLDRDEVTPDASLVDDLGV
ncbi:MAG: hypothetical protein ACI9G1_002550 [Pirellulaceae bacterium]|jgi:hypothetical protein